MDDICFSVDSKVCISLAESLFVKHEPIKSKKQGEDSGLGLKQLAKVCWPAVLPLKRSRAAKLTEIKIIYFKNMLCSIFETSFSILIYRLVRI